MERVISPATPHPHAARLRLDWLCTLLVLAGLGWVVHSQSLDHPALQYTFLGRFPLIAGSLLLAIPFVFGVVAPRMLGNLLVVSVPGQFFLAALATFLAHVVASTTHSLLVYGPERYGLKPAKDWLVMTWTAIGTRSGEFSPVALVLAAPLVVTVAWFTYREGTAAGRKGLALAGGLFVATVLGVIAAVATTWLAIPFQRVLATYLADELRVVAKSLGRGYLSPEGSSMGAGHVHAIGFLIVAVLIYTVAWPLLRPDHRHPACRWFRRHVPPLAYVLQILIVACWLLAGMSFYLDLFRVPPVLVIAGLSICFHAISRADHYWDLLAMRPTNGGADPTVGEHTGLRGSPAVDAEELPLPSDAGLDAWLDRQEAGGVPRPTLVVLAVSGGGILSAAWSTLMLARLGERYPRLASSVRLVSAVSGGSVGMAYWLEHWRRAASRDAGWLPNLELGDALAVHGRASASSLEATAWGLAFPDLMRVVMPQVSRYDRGWAIEQAWAEALGRPPATIGDWVREMEHGHLPAFSFGSTLVETGERFLFTPITTADRDLRVGRRLSRSFLGQFPGGDVSLFTAARLSAAFPYVGPNARARYTGPSTSPELRDPPQYHFADGGFFDNFGTTTALEWIDSILERRARIVEAENVAFGSRASRRNEQWEDLSRVLLVQMRPFPIAEKNPPPYRSVGISGWVNGTFGPLRTLVNIWSSTQTARGDAEFEMLRKHWTSRGVDVETAIFEYRGPGRLSWSLTTGDRIALAAESDRYLERRGEDAERSMEVMDAFLAR